MGSTPGRRTAGASSRECYSKSERRKDGHYKDLLQPGDGEAPGSSGSRCLSVSSAPSAPDAAPGLGDSDAAPGGAHRGREGRETEVVRRRWEGTSRRELVPLFGKFMDGEYIERPI